MREKLEAKQREANRFPHAELLLGLFTEALERNVSAAAAQAETRQGSTRILG